MPTLNLWCPTLDRVDSYGRMVLELSRGLQEEGWDVNEFCISGYSHPPMKGELVTGGIFAGIPSLFKIYPALAQMGPKLALTMFESTRVPAGWAEPLNQCQAMVVPSPFLIDTFRQSGVTIPIHVAPLGISEVFHNTVVRVPTYTEENPFTIIAIADRGIRKNWVMATQAFNRAFGDDRRYRLILKSRTGIVNFQITNPNIEIIAQDYTDEEQAALYQRAHLMLFPSRGEGFGFPPREFAATGGLAMATNWGGTADDLEQWGIPIPCTMEPAYSTSESWAGKVGDWAVPDLDQLTHQLRDVVDNYTAYAARCPEYARFVKETYTWSRFAREIGRQYACVRDATPALSA